MTRRGVGWVIAVTSSAAWWVMFVGVVVLVVLNTGVSK